MFNNDIVNTTDENKREPGTGKEKERKGEKSKIEPKKDEECSNGAPDRQTAADERKYSEIVVKEIIGEILDKSKNIINRKLRKTLRKRLGRNWEQRRKISRILINQSYNTTFGDNPFIGDRRYREKVAEIEEVEIQEVQIEEVQTQEIEIIEEL